MTKLQAQLFWQAVPLLEPNYEHKFLLGFRVIYRVLYRLPLNRPDANDKLENNC